MSYGPLSMARRHILGDLYMRCDATTEEIPVFLGGDEPELVGHVDQSLGHYADAFTFHLSEDLCKRMSSGHFSYSFEYRPSDAASSTTRSRVSLVSITLVSRKGYERPVPKVRRGPAETHK
jgi:hypothetical protein